ncbi:MAG: helix-turn-helix domain-containing protein [Tetragenococcus koreensis]|nr:helix-turn-helix domain-containing protein [Tetragenococcus koreensis]
MWELIPVKERKLYTLLEKLYFAENPLTLKDLSHEIDSSRRTISYYMEELKTRVADTGGFLETSAEGYILVLSKNISIDTFQHQAMQASPSLQLIETLFLKNEMSGIDLENDLHISTSTLGRMITKLKDKLSDYELTLGIHPYQIIGDEFLVRRFFTSYFLETYGYQAWPLPYIDYSEIEKLVDSLFQIDSIRFETVNVHKFILFTAVSIIRERFGHNIYFSKLADEHHQADEFNHMRSQVNAWLSHVDIDENKKELYEKIYTFYMFYYFSPYTKETISQSNPRYTEKIEKRLSQLAQSFDLPLTDFNHIATKIDDMLYQNSTLSYAKPLDTYLIFKPSDYNMLRLYSRKYPHFYDALTRLLYELYDLYDIDPDKINDEELLYLIISRWDNLSFHLYQKYNSCHILVYSPNSYRHAENIARLLQTKLERGCQITVYGEPILNKQRLNNYTFDILATAGSVHLDIEQPIIALHNGMNRRHLQPLFKAIDDAFKNNCQKTHDASVIISEWTSKMDSFHS